MMVDPEETEKLKIVCVCVWDDKLTTSGVEK